MRSGPWENGAPMFRLVELKGKPQPKRMKKAQSFWASRGSLVPLAPVAGAQEHAGGGAVVQQQLPGVRRRTGVTNRSHLGLGPQQKKIAFFA